MKKRLHLDALSNYLAEQNNIPNKLEILELGVYLGDGIETLVVDLGRNNVQWNRIVGIDSFEGLPLTESKNFSKFGMGAYDSRKQHLYPVDYVGKRFPAVLGYTFIPCWFDKLSAEHIKQYQLTPFDIIIIDCDLYKSAKDALIWLFENKLVKPTSIFVYDEFYIEGYYETSEMRAHTEIFSRYDVTAQEVWHYCYNDKTTGEQVRQSIFQITGIGVDL